MLATVAPRAADETLRLAELIAALSLATDLGNAMPLEWTMRTCRRVLRDAPAQPAAQ
jgi:hypothetical protein